MIWNRRNSISGFLVMLTAIALLSSPATRASAQEINEQEVYEIGLEVYTYLYPLVTMDVTRRNHINHEPGRMQGFGPMNMFHHFRTYPKADDRDVVRPNFDTLNYNSDSKRDWTVKLYSTSGSAFVFPTDGPWTQALAQSVEGRRFHPISC